MNRASSADAAWKEYLDGIKRIRDMIFGHPYAADAQDRPGAHYLFHQVQAIAFNRVIAPNTAYPRFYLHGQLEPMTYSMGGGSADIQYRQSFVDGAGSYRIWGRRGSACLSLIQVMDGYWGERRESIGVRAWSLDVLGIAPGDHFELIACARERRDRWLQLDESIPNSCIFFREIFGNWESEQPSEIHIAPLAPNRDRPVNVSEADMAVRLKTAVAFMEEFIGRYSQSMIEDVVSRAGYNVMVTDETSWPGANAASGYFFLAYKLELNETLIITLDWEPVPYWGTQVTDVWHQTCEPIYHQSSLNSFQTVRDDDGLYRLVLSIRDPGAANWLDLVGHSKGFLELRVVPGREVVMPRTEKVALVDIRSALPVSTRYLTPEERNAELTKRRNGALRRWRY
ncbi:hypothetical protein ACG33_10600 [Steroidobacter denitrificans]|uniref:DUF1214 domain-containing protein n=1 Tax=Steroidobacter denitrificans TaxID=465721 RepID=A0A127FD59_STEDE|nr:hypothetical protein [Steroidobacter denitrificans]AMN47539.1 hypothetical protein ACG33_10600 [Steroidobacter denitrificans]